MSVYASSSDQVLLGLLWAVRGESGNDFSEPLLGEVFERFQASTGMILYGPVEDHDPSALRSELAADLSALESRGMIHRTVNPHARVTTRGAPVASALLLAPPLDRLVEIARTCLGAG